MALPILKYIYICMCVCVCMCVFYGKRPNPLQAPRKRAHKSIHSVYKDTKRPYKAERDTKKNSLSLLRAQPFNQVYYGYWVISYVHSNPSQKITNKGLFVFICMYVYICIYVGMYM